jgi:hypothetical protein
VIILLAVPVLLWQSPVPAQDTPILVVTDAAYPPCMFGTASAKGRYPEIIKTAFSLSGIPVKTTG